MNLNALSSRDKVLQNKESINVCTEALTDSLASTMAVQYENRGSIPRKGKQFFAAPKRLNLLWCSPNLFNLFKA
jgi:hypothetical protein